MARTIFWHDGTLDQIRVVGPSRRRLGSVEIELSLYPTNSSAKRAKFTLVCSGVSQIEMSADMLELQDNASAGNIEDGRIARSGAKSEVELRLVRGMLKLVAGRIGFRKSE
jgi:hypothetical protein